MAQSKQVLSTKKKYDSSVIFLYATGRENLLPKSFRKKIPYSTISTWRKTNYSEYLGHEFRQLFEHAFDAAAMAVEYERLKKISRSITKAWVKLSFAVKPVIRSASKNRALQMHVLEAVEYLKGEFGLEKTLKMIGLSRALYFEWVLMARFDCFDSFRSLCVRRHPQQLELTEVRKMKSLLTDTELGHWPIVSIAGLAIRERKIMASLYSWYKYARLLDITRKPPKKAQKTVGLVANYPNEYLHVDTTYYALIDGSSVCITFVMDNYSKMILGFHVAERLSFEVVRNALSHAMETVMKHPGQRNSFLVADGGSENHNKNIDKFISELTGHKLTKIRSLKDIRFSNSPVEAVHRTMKSRYLRGRKFESISALNKYLEWAVMDYNVLRPHYRHRPRTPHEVYFNQPLGFDIRSRMKEAIQARITSNKCAQCIQCRGAKKITCTK